MGIKRGPIKNRNKNDLDYQEDKEEVYPEQEYQITQQPVKVELDPLEEGPTRITQVPESTSPH